MFRSKEYLHRFTETENSELLYLCILSVYILSKESYSTKEVELYLGKTTAFNDYSFFRGTSNDLYMLLHLQSSNKYFDYKEFRLFVNAILKKLPFNVYRYFASLETQMGIKCGFAMNIKRDISNWCDLSKERKTVMLNNIYRELYRLSPRSEIAAMILELKEKGYV